MRYLPSIRFRSRYSYYYTQATIGGQILVMESMKPYYPLKEIKLYFTKSYVLP